MNHEKCISSCPKYNLCQKMVDTGLADLVIAGSTCSDVEFQSEDGELISSAEFFGTADMTTETAENLRQAGHAMMGGARGLQSVLLAGCSAGEPYQLSDTVLICQSSESRAVEFTETDLRG